MEIKDLYNKCQIDKNNSNIKSIHGYSNIIEEWIDTLNIQKYKDFLNIVRINQENNLILLKYDMIEAFKSDLYVNSNSVYRECRSLVIDIENECIVSCPFQKFFNIDEVEDNKVENIIKEIANAKRVEVSNKLDCSMQTLVWYNESIFMFGSHSLNPSKSWRLSDGYKAITQEIKEMIHNHKNLTFIFENINLKDKKVVNYAKEQEGLYLIGIRNNLTGYQYSYTECKIIADKYNILITELEDLSLDQILKIQKNAKGNEKEGFVVWIDGRLIKIKVDDYVKLHKIVGQYTSSKYIIEAICNNTFDDFLILAPKQFHEEILNIASIVKDYCERANNYIDFCYNKAPKNNRKTFMIWTSENVEKEFEKYVRSKYLNQKYHVLKKNNRYRTIEEITASGE